MSPVEAMEAAIGRYPTAYDHIELHGVVAANGSPAWFSFEVLDSGLRTHLAPTLADIAVRSGIDASRIAVDSDSLHVTDTSPRELAETCDAMIREHFGVRSDYAVRTIR